MINYFLLVVLPRLYERLCEEKANDDEEGDEADSNYIGKRHRSLTSGMLYPLKIFCQTLLNAMKLILKIFSNHSN